MYRDNLLEVKRVDLGCISSVFTKKFEKMVGKFLWTHLCIEEQVNAKR